MPSVGVITIVGVVVLCALVYVFLKIRMKDLLDEFIKRRSATSRVCTRAEFVEGRDRIPVALALTDDTIYYENPDLQASLDLKLIDEVEYDDETTTGQSVEGKALRLRAHGHAFEFVMDANTARLWQNALPPHRLDEGPAAQAM